MKLYLRCFLLTLAVLLLVGAVIGIERNRPLQQASVETWFFLCLVSLLALCCAFIAFFGSERFVERWADMMSRHEIAVAIGIIALPIYGLARLFGFRDV